MCRAENAWLGADRWLGSPPPSADPLVRYSSRPPSAPQTKSTQRHSSLKRRKLLLIPPRLLTDHLKEKAPSPTVSSCGTAACCPGQKKGPSQRACRGGCGPAAPRGTGIAQPAGQGSSRGTRWSRGQAGKSAEWLGSESVVHGQAGARLSWSPALLHQRTDHQSQPEHLGWGCGENPGGAGQGH